MNTLVKAAGVVAALAFLSPAGVLAAGGSAGSAGSTQKSFDALDANHDGKLSASELSAAGMSADISKADANKDGKLDRSEFSAFEAGQSAPGGTQPGAMDKNAPSAPSGGGAY